MSVASGVWNKRNPDKVKDSWERWRKKHPNEYKKAREKSRLKNRYGLSFHDVDNILIKQDHKCAICGKPLEEKKRQIDHDHLTHKVRGILCRSCNNGLGRFGDDINLLLKAIKYVAGNQ